MTQLPMLSVSQHAIPPTFTRGKENKRKGEKKKKKTTTTKLATIIVLNQQKHKRSPTFIPVLLFTARIRRHSSTHPSVTKGRMKPFVRKHHAQGASKVTTLRSAPCASSPLCARGYRPWASSQTWYPLDTSYAELWGRRERLVHTSWSGHRTPRLPRCPVRTFHSPTNLKHDTAPI